MNCYRSITFYCIATLYVLCQFSFTGGHAAKTKASRITNGTKSAGKYPYRTGGTLITLRSAVDGTPQDQCECRQWYLCGQEDTVDTSLGGPSCDGARVCCRISSTTTEEILITMAPGPTKKPTHTPTAFDCGIRNSGSEIVDRIASPDHLKSTSFGEFPWMALLLTAEIDKVTRERTDNVFLCGASLISSKVVLTAGHCVHDVTDITLLKVRVGEYDTQNVSDKEWKPLQDRQVLKITSAPNFESDTLHNDLAVVEVVEPFIFDYHVHPICTPMIPNAYDYDPNNCVATGWGKDAFGPAGRYARTLKKVDLKILPNVQCQEELRKTRLGDFFALDSSFICAKGNDGMDTCEGDGGGPLACALRDEPNRYVQVGIVSWGIGCANGIPAAYASLKRNAVWLNEELHAAMIFKGKHS